METPAFKYAGFWKRFLAFIIDGLVLGVLEGILFIPFLVILFVPLMEMFGVNITGADVTFDNEESGAMIFAMIGAFFLLGIAAIGIGWLYSALMESSAGGATLGKMTVGIRVTDLNGNRISFGRASGRYFAKMISRLILYIGFIMAAFTRQKQALHDIIAGCLVIERK
jgi:uncharacterized RDD family membrane protein YckC